MSFEQWWHEQPLYRELQNQPGVLIAAFEEISRKAYEAGRESVGSPQKSPEKWFVEVRTLACNRYNFEIVSPNKPTRAAIARMVYLAEGGYEDEDYYADTIHILIDGEEIS